MHLAQASLVAPSVEVAEALELREAAFCIIKAAQPAGSRARPYHKQYLRWLKQGLGVGEAYTQRAAIHNAAHCYLQVSCACSLSVALTICQSEECDKVDWA